MNEEKAILDIVDEKYREFKKNQRNIHGNAIFKYVRLLAIVAIITALINTFVFERALVHGESMYPTLENGNSVFEYKLGLKFGLPKRGEIVTFFQDENDVYIKRVIAIPGDVVDIKDGYVFVNDTMITENYLPESVYGKTFKPDVGEGAGISYPYKVNPNEIYVLGDNRSNSRDSRTLGAISTSKLRGKALIRMFPFKKIY